MFSMYILYIYIYMCGLYSGLTIVLSYIYIYVLYGSVYMVDIWCIYIYGLFVYIWFVYLNSWFISL